jgi:hypothetical protein
LEEVFGPVVRQTTKLMNLTKAEYMISCSVEIDIDDHLYFPMHIELTLIAGSQIIEQDVG